MGRFFQARPIELSQNNIYQPSLELMMAANEYGNNEIKETAEQRQSILDDLQIRYREDLDTNNVNTYKKEIEDKVNNITELLRKDPQSKEANSMLYQVRRDMNKDFGKNGKIYNIQKTYDNDVAYREKLDGIKDMSEMDKQRNYEGHLNKFKQLNPDGSINTHYDPQHVIIDEEYMPDMVKDFKLISPTEINNRIENLKLAGYITKNTEDTEGVVREHYYKDWIEAHPAVKAGIIERQNSGIFGDRNFVVDENGNIDYTQGQALKESDFMRNYNYTKTTTEKGYQADSEYARKAQNYREDEATRKANNAALLLENDKNVSANFDLSETARYHLKFDLQDVLTNVFLPNNNQYNFLPQLKGSSLFESKKNNNQYFNINYLTKAFEGKGNVEMINTVKKHLQNGINQNPKNLTLKTALNKIELVEEKYTKGMTASYAELGNYGLDPKQIDYTRTKTNEVLNANYNSLEMTFPGVYILKDGKKIPAKNVRPEALKNQTLQLDNGDVIQIQGTTYEDKSNILYLPPGTPPHMLNISDTNFNVRFKYKRKNPNNKSFEEPIDSDPVITRQAFTNNKTQIGLSGSLQ